MVSALPTIRAVIVVFIDMSEVGGFQLGVFHLRGRFISDSSRRLPCIHVLATAFVPHVRRPLWVVATILWWVSINHNLRLGFTIGESSINRRWGREGIRMAVNMDVPLAAKKHGEDCHCD
jgi:hypothetical protein